VKNYVFPAVLLFLLTVPASPGKMTIAVMDFQAKGIDTTVAQNVSELIRGEIINAGIFTVIERAQMGEILKEQGFQQSGCTDITCAVEIGKILSANKMLVGSVMKIGSSIIIAGRVVDVQSGVGEFSENQDCESEAKLLGAVKLFTEKLSARIQGKPITSVSPDAASSNVAQGDQGIQKNVPRLEGSYFASGRNPNGSTYTGTVQISKGNNSYHFFWKIGNSTYNGIGVLKDRTITVDWGQDSPVIYLIQDDGRLVGKWANGTASETLTPE
jgi:TolB-like protein